MKKITENLRLMFTDRGLRRRIFFTLGILMVFRLLATIPLPNVDISRLAHFFESNQALGFLNIFSGSALNRLSIVMLGVGPYITASIIMQLLTMMSPKVKSMYQEEGEIGRKKFSQISRIVAVPVAVLQAIAFMTLLQQNGLITYITSFDKVVNIIIAIAGTMFLMWLGELMTEFGIGNGTSMIIFAGIVAALPPSLVQLQEKISLATGADMLTYALLFVLAIVVIALVVFVSEAERSVPVTYAKQVRAGKTYAGVSTYLPLRINQAGVIPIIFALSILVFPQMIANFVKSSVSSESIKHIADFIISITNPTTIAYIVLYFVFVVIFTFFYTAVTFDPDQISENLQKGGAFIPGIRPGQATSEYLANITTRITLIGALFLGLIAVLPLIIQKMTGEQTIAIGGTALLIVVSVVIDLVKKVEAHISAQQY